MCFRAVFRGFYSRFWLECEVFVFLVKLYNEAFAMLYSVFQSTFQRFLLKVLVYFSNLLDFLGQFYTDGSISGITRGWCSSKWYVPIIAMILIWSKKYLYQDTSIVRGLLCLVLILTMIMLTFIFTSSLVLLATYCFLSAPVE